MKIQTDKRVAPVWEPYTAHVNEELHDGFAAHHIARGLGALYDLSV